MYADAAERAQGLLQELVQQPDSSETDRALAGSWLAYALGENGDTDAAWVSGLHALAAAQQHQQESPAILGTVLLRLTRIAHLTSRIQRGIEMGTQALALLESALGPAHEEVALCCNYLGLLHRMQGNNAIAQEWQERAYAIRLQRFGEMHPVVGGSCNNLGILRWAQGDYAGAEFWLGKALAIREAALGPDHPDVALTCNNLGIIRDEQGDYTAAERWHLRCLAIREKSLKPGHHSVAATYGNLGLVSLKQGHLDAAERWHHMALAVMEQSRGPEHPEVALCCHHLGAVFQEKGDFTQALAMRNRAVQIRTQAKELEHPDAFPDVLGMGQVMLGLGDLEAACSWADQARTLMAEQRPEIDDQLEWMRFQTALAVAQGDPETIAHVCAEVAEHERALLQAIDVWGSEESKLLYATRLWTSFEQRQGIVQMSGGLQSPELIRGLAEDAVTRKGRVLNALQRQRAALRGQLDAPHQALLDRELELRRRLAGFTFSSLGSPADTELSGALANELAQIEAELAATSQFYAARQQPVTLQQVQQALPPESRLIEIVRYRPYLYTGALPEQERWQAARYTAYVIAPQGEPQAVDLGEAASLDELIQQWSAELQSALDCDDTGSQLDARVWAPLLPSLQDATRLFIAPDGALNRLPWSMLPAPDGEYRLTRFTVSYLSSGRELVHAASIAPSTGPIVLAGAPDFGDQPAESTARAMGPDIQSDRQPLVFRSLPGAYSELEQLSQLLGIPALYGAAVTVDWLRTVGNPALLHLATHAFFLDDATNSVNQQSRATLAPMLRSGIALSGANRREASNPGIMASLEVMSLPLWGTQLAVLSACATAQGSLHTGEGVFGLRRALSIAGVRSQVLTLWAIEDDSTAALMTHFYAQLMAGTEPGEALALVQREAYAAGWPLRGWGGFVASGLAEPLLL